MSQKPQRKISKAAIGAEIEKGIPGNDILRVSGMQQLRSFRSSKAKSQSREQQRLVSKYGEQDERVIRMNTSLDANSNYISNLDMELNRATAPRKKIGTTSWNVQGRVYDQQGCPIVGADVSILSGDGHRIEQIPPTKTDTKGRYNITYQAQKNELVTQADAKTSVRAAAIRINRNTARNEQVFVRAIDSRNDEVCADSTLMVPKPGSCNYRDLILDIRQDDDYKIGNRDRRSSRYLGNSSTTELHDLKNEKAQCQIDNIRIDHCFNFKSEKEARALGYDYCAYCFGREKSKR